MKFSLECVIKNVQEIQERLDSYKVCQRLSVWALNYTILELRIIYDFHFISNILQCSPELSRRLLKSLTVDDT